MKHTFKFDTSIHYKLSLNLVIVSVQTEFLGRPYKADYALSGAEIKDARFDIVEATIIELEQMMEMHLAKVSSS